MDQTKILTTYTNYLRKCGYPETTIRSKRVRLTKPMRLGLVNGRPEDLLAYLNQKSSQTKLSTYSDVSSFWEWALREPVSTLRSLLGGRVEPKRGQTNPNPYKAFRGANRRLFKNVKTYKHTALSLAEAEEKINRLSNKSYRLKALELLYSGMRWHDSFAFDENKNVTIQKGGTEKVVYWIKKIKRQTGQGTKLTKGEYTGFHKALKKLGLGVHELRKVYASHLAYEFGLGAYEISTALGHSSLHTALHYVNGDSSEKLKALAA